MATWRASGEEISLAENSYRKSAAVSATLSGAAAVLGACTTGPTTARRQELDLARPDAPVTLPLHDDNPPLEDGLEPESGVTLKIYNWEEYLWPRIVDEFAAKYDVKVEITNFSDMDDALATLRSGSKFDVFFHRTDVISRLVADKLLQPLNHNYISNLAGNVWPVYQNPFYDQGACYGVPYTVYTTGLVWRIDRVEEDIAGSPIHTRFFGTPDIRVVSTCSTTIAKRSA